LEDEEWTMRMADEPNLRNTEERTPHVERLVQSVMKLFSSANPAGPLFSGWNWNAARLP
jgi:hypothetical protein